MKPYCITVILHKEKPGLRIPFILDLGKVTFMLQGQENNERVPQHTYMMPGLSCSHSVLGSQQWAGYLGTWRFPPKSAWVPRCQESTENRGRGQGGGPAIARRGCVGCVPSLGDFQKDRIPEMSLMYLHCSKRLKNLHPTSPQNPDT